MDQTSLLIVALYFLCFIGLIVGIIWWQKKHGKLSEKRFAIIFLSYFSLFFMTELLPLGWIRLFGQEKGSV